jgi:hypothetical protein
MLSDKLIQKIIKQTDEDIIEDILKGNGYMTPIVKRKEYDDGSVRIALILEVGSVVDITINKDGSVEQKNISKQKTEEKKSKDSELTPIKGDLNVGNVEQRLKDAGKQPYVGDSSRIYGKVEERDKKGKPVYGDYMKNEGARVNNLLYLLSQLEADEVGGHTPLTPQEKNQLKRIR